jgi:DNA (cytosine-5)-methyltransferase 1
MKLSCLIVITMATQSNLIQFKVSDQLLAEFAQACEANGTPNQSQVLRDLCEAYVSKTDMISPPAIQASGAQQELDVSPTRINQELTKVVFKVGELYSGPGGVGMGAAHAEVIKDGRLFTTEPAWVNDFDKDSCETWKRNVLQYYQDYKGFEGDCEIIHGDVRQINIDGLADVDGLMFGFPCNDFSIVGEHKGFDGDFGPLYSYGVKVLRKKKQPKWFLAENVGGITSSNQGYAFEKILADLEGSGYAITAHKYKLEEYGVPQARHRVIIVGFRNDLGLEFQVPAPSGERVTAGQALANIPAWASNQERTKQSKTVQERLSFIKPGENVWNAKDLPAHLKLNVPRTQLSHIYKRLDPNQPSYTVTGSGGGGTHMYHWTENRALTNRERACLQTFPMDFSFYGSKESVRKQIGMAIPVKGAKLLVEAILKTLAGEPYESVAPNLRAPH